MTRRPPVVHRDPNIMSGTPVFVGTRVPAQSLFDYLEGGDTLDEFLRQFPTVKREQALRSSKRATACCPVRVLLDENLPHDLIAALAAHTISTEQRGA